jgi:hypothetical protein
MFQKPHRLVVTRIQVTSRGHLIPVRKNVRSLQKHNATPPTYAPQTLRSSAALDDLYKTYLRQESMRVHDLDPMRQQPRIPYTLVGSLGAEGHTMELTVRCRSD